MTKSRADITLGGGDLYLNNVEIGHLTGPVEFSYDRQKLILQPAGSGLTSFRVLGFATLKAAMAELSAEHLRLALGLGVGNLSTIVGNPSYNPASFTAPTDSTSYDGLRFGADTVSADDTFALRFEHQRPSGKKIIIILYAAFCLSNLTVPFNEDSVNLANIVFRGTKDESRDSGDQVGMVLVES